MNSNATAPIAAHQSTGPGKKVFKRTLLNRYRSPVPLHQIEHPPLLIGTSGGSGQTYRTRQPDAMIRCLHSGLLPVQKAFSPIRQVQISPPSKFKEAVRL